MADRLKKRIVLMGATGSIGTSCQDVVRAHADSMEFVALTAHSRWQDLAKACHEFHPRRAVLTGASSSDIPGNAFPSDVTVLYGEDQVARCAASVDADVVVAGVVGAAGLRGAWAAIEAGKTIGLANKETLVMAGPLVRQLASDRQARLIPVDSEHSAIYQALQSGRPSEVRRVILTASGGPFRTWPRETLETVTAAKALSHPTWNMGPKITIDSATMMNKALEVIEARWLFDLPAEQIDVVVHPQSIVHSMVEFTDGSVIAQMSPPDMRLPIQYALTWPERMPCPASAMDFTKSLTLEFTAPDLERFPALELGYEVARSGGSAGAVLNAANETAVQRFLNGELEFLEISRLCRSVLHAHAFDATPSLEDVLRLDQWARQEAFRWKSSTSRWPSALTSSRC